MSDDTRQQVTRWFQKATGHAPYPFQLDFACEPTLYELVNVPTGLGKTGMRRLAGSGGPTLRDPSDNSTNVRGFVRVGGTRESWKPGKGLTPLGRSERPLRGWQGAAGDEERAGSGLAMFMR